MSRWFRFYDDTIHNAKALRLSDKMFRAWVGMLCLASKYDGAIPKADVAVVFRVSDAVARGIVDYLIEHNLLEDRGDVVTPHDWDQRQYKSDTSTDRVKRFRNAKRNVSETPNETQGETPPETETETEQKIDSAGASVHSEFLKLVGSDHDDPTLFGSLYGIQGMIARGFSRETILAGAANGMRGKARPPNWNYFAKCIESENEQRSSPAKKEIKNGNSGNVIAAADKLLERMRQFDEPGGVRGGEGQTVVRVLPER